jgi:hypothetical protein
MHQPKAISIGSIKKKSKSEIFMPTHSPQNIMDRTKHVTVYEIYNKYATWIKTKSKKKNQQTVT